MMGKSGIGNFKWDQLIERLLIAYFIFATFFLTIRLLLLGSDSSDSIQAFFLSVLPEIFILFILIVLLRNRNATNKLSLKEFTLFDYLVIGYICSNIILGSFLSGEVLLTLHAIRLTYILCCFIS